MSQTETPQLKRQLGVPGAIMMRLGAMGCLFLAFWVEAQTWLVGQGLILVGLLWHAIAQRLRRSG